MLGVLALQGDFARHLDAWHRLGVEAREVRYARDLEGVDGLTIPGGESTTLLRLLESTGLRGPLEDFAERGALFGTCAGSILLGRSTSGLPAPTLGVLDADVERNAYGRQVDSFEADLEVHRLGGDPVFRGVFIRAPRFSGLGKTVEVVARHAGEPVGLRQGRILALAFHPELTDDLRFHRFFLDEVVGSARNPGAPKPNPNPNPKPSSVAEVSR
jgi:5'-phosphate synthase pdxT subunit